MLNPQELLDAVAEAILVLDSQFNIKLANQMAQRMLGMRTKKVCGCNISEVLELLTIKQRKINLKSIILKPDLETIETAILRTTKRDYYVQIKWNKVNLFDETDYLVTFTDITRTKELEHTKDEFLSVASHELRTPMTIIKGYLWMMGTERHGKLADKHKEYVKKAILSTERMIALINDILNIAKIEQGKVELHLHRVELVELVNELIIDFRLTAAQHDLYLNLETNKDKHFVYVDTQKLREIFVNVLGNAMKFTHKGGITVKLEDQGDFVMVSVVDTGIGIRKSDFNKLFLKFGRLDSSYEKVAESGGTGLGLYIVKSYTENMGGEVEIKSDGRNKGTTFCFTLSKKAPIKG
ncbi:PAS domain S-box protein [Patescibacteria group bacterium]|nr:PAS domain S-box protein [Patescibacteria group bacterium]